MRNSVIKTFHKISGAVAFKSLLTKLIQNTKNKAKEEFMIAFVLFFIDRKSAELEAVIKIKRLYFHFKFNKGLKKLKYLMKIRRFFFYKLKSLKHECLDQTKYFVYQVFLITIFRNQSLHI